jgi:F-type H+-transporting ATPase subunit epsilon
MSLEVSVVTIEREVYAADDADMVIAPGVEGVLGVLARHEPVVAALVAGELVIVRGDQRDVMAISGGYLEVHGTEVVVMADVAEHAYEIDVERAEAARARAQEQLATARGAAESERALAALRRAGVRLRVARRRGRSAD